MSPASSNDLGSGGRNESSLDSVVTSGGTAFDGTASSGVLPSAILLIRLSSVSNRDSGDELLAFSGLCGEGAVRRGDSGRIGTDGIEVGLGIGWSALDMSRSLAAGRDGMEESRSPWKPTFPR